MYSAAWKSLAMAIVMALAVIGHVEAQQQQHHRKGAQISQEQAPETSQDTPTQAPMMQRMQGMMGQMQGMMQQMHGMMRQMDRGMGRGRMMQGDDDELGRSGRMGRGRMMGHGGGMGHTRMMQRKLDHLTQQLNLSDEQQAKVKALGRTQAKNAIQLQADIEMASIDLHQLLDAESVDMDAVKAALQTIAAKEVERHVAHITAMQDIRQLLTPEQQQQFHTVWGSMMHGRGGMMGHRGRMGRSGMREHGKMMGGGGMKGPRGMNNPCGAPRGKADN
ncbi:MAG: periplasmic heavy metal sensor [Candidatus Tectomicrobia bacterium]|nr:periplasmic heavy metal sensor [Candidatus Tectomicrobia bacterium]